MKHLSPALQAHLNTGTTTLAWCWRVRRRDGVALGFTDHDHSLSFDDTVFEAATGFTASDMKESVGLSVDNLDVSGALRSDSLNEAELGAGMFDDASVEIWRVNWSNISQRVLMRSGTLGEVKRTGTAFTAEIRGLTHVLQQPKGRLYQYTCDANLGDTRCAITVSSLDFTTTATVITTSADGHALTVTLGSTYPADWFTRGLATFVSGAGVTARTEIRRHAIVGTAITLDLWQSFPTSLVAGNTLTLTAGCDKHIETCRQKFSNVENFRGFPHMPGNDFVAAVAQPGDAANNGLAR
jgi:uncharacterized phage protein (TIGR02218 family)